MYNQQICTKTKIKLKKNKAAVWEFSAFSLPEAGKLQGCCIDTHYSSSFDHAPCLKLSLLTIPTILEGCKK